MLHCCNIKGVQVKNSKYAFTMIEVVFVIVVLGILAAIAVPKLATTRNDAIVSKARSEIASIRSAIITERQSRLIRGDSSYIAGTSINTNTSNGLFGGILTYPITSSVDSGRWSVSGVADINTSKYNYNVSGVNVLFTYTRSDGKFGCDTTHGTYGTQCKKLLD